MTTIQRKIIEVREIGKTFSMAAQDVQILKSISFDVDWGDFMIIFGPSGSGKSTLLHTILGLEPPTTGSIRFLDEDIYYEKDEDARSDFRKKHIGMVYQQPNWIKALTVRENVAFPMFLLGGSRDTALDRADDLLSQLDLLQWAHYRPTELSGGQQQRVAVARALINNPQVIIADEPTGNLDFENGQKLMNMLFELNRDQEKTVIMVTHDLEYLPYSKTAVHIFDGGVDGIYSGDEKNNLLNKVHLKRRGDMPDISLQVNQSNGVRIRSNQSLNTNSQKVDVTK